MIMGGQRARAIVWIYCLFCRLLRQVCVRPNRKDQIHSTLLLILPPRLSPSPHIDMACSSGLNDLSNNQLTHQYIVMNDSNQDMKMRAFKVIIVGPQAVGKSSMLFRLSEAKFNTAYLTTVGIDFKTYTSQVASKLYSLQIWDTAGQEKFRSLTSSYYKGSQGCVCVFDLSDLSSLERCDYYINKALEENVPKECIYLVGNKLDIPHEDRQRGKEMAAKYQVNYDECSAKDGTKVTEIFDALASKLVNKFGRGANEEGEQLKPKVSVKEGKRNCCG